MIDKEAEKLRSLIQNNHIEEALEIIRKATNCHKSGINTFIVLNEENSTPNMIEEILTSFFNTRENGIPKHRIWVHSLAYFTHLLWKRRLINWIKRFYKVAFKSANELGDTTCSDRLINDFVQLSKWDDNPAHFHLTLENLDWMDWCEEYTKYLKARIEAGRFETEESFLRWKLQNMPKTKWDNDAQSILIDINTFRSIIQRLRDLGVDMTELSNFEENLLRSKLSELERERQITTLDSRRECLEIGIQKTREALMNLM